MWEAMEQTLHKRSVFAYLSYGSRGQGEEYITFQTLFKDEERGATGQNAAR
jgi:hypothetical protein